MYCRIELDEQGKKKPYFGRKWGKMSKEESNARFIQTGQGLYVIDIDTKIIPEKYKKFLNILGEPTVETARGYHYYIKSDVPMKNHTDIFHDADFKVDIRGEGGLVFTEYWGDEKEISYTRVGKVIKDKKGKIFKSLPEHVRNPRTKKSNIEDCEDCGTWSIKKIKELLEEKSIFDYSRREEWMGMLGAIYNAAKNKNKARAVAMKWSREDKEQWDEKAFDNVWSQLESGQYTGWMPGVLLGEKKDPASLFSAEPKFNQNIMDAVTDYKSAEYNPNDFPPVLRNYMSNIAEQHNVNFSSTVPYMLMMLSQFIGTKVGVQMLSDWTHVPIIWGLVIAEAGAGKSPLLNKLSSNLWEEQHEKKKKYDNKMKEYKLKLANYEASKKNGGGVPEPEKPRLKMIIMDKSTPEALYDELEFNKGGVLIWKDELKSLFIKNDERTEQLRTDMISAWSGQSIIRNTKGNGHNLIRHAYLRMGGSVQPEVLKQILNNNKSGMSADGFIARFQVPARMVSTSNRFADVKINIFAKTNFNNLIKNKLKKLKKHTVLTFDAEANELKTKFAEELIEAKENTTTSMQKEYLSKAISTFASIMTILHVVEHKGTVISHETVERAKNITNTAIDIMFTMYELEEIEKAEENTAEYAISKWLKTTTLFDNHEYVTSSQVYKSTGRKYKLPIIRSYFKKHPKYEVIPKGLGIRIFKL
jgi:hypothetical protein